MANRIFRLHERFRLICNEKFADPQHVHLQQTNNQRLSLIQERNMVMKNTSSNERKLVWSSFIDSFR